MERTSRTPGRPSVNPFSDRPLRLLLVSPFLPHARARHAGGRLVHYLVQRLSERFEVEVASRCRPGEEAAAATLGRQVAALHLAPAAPTYREGNPISFLRSLRSVRGLARLAQRLLAERRFDLCQVEYSELGFFWRAGGATPCFLTCHDVRAKPARRLYERARGAGRPAAWLSWRLQQELEGRAVRRFHGLFTLSEEDRRWLARTYGELPARVLRYPGGVGFAGLPRAEVAGRVGYLGTLNRQVNADGVRWLVREVWPRVMEEVADAELVVAGVGGAPKLAAEIGRTPRARFLGEVDDAEAFAKSAAVIAAPVLVGGGVIVKVLDALAAGVPVVTTPRGNEGIEAVAGRDLGVAETAESFAAEVGALLRDPARRAAFARAGREFAARSFSPEAFAFTLEGAYREALARRSSAGSGG